MNTFEDLYSDLSMIMYLKKHYDTQSLNKNFDETQTYYYKLSEDEKNKLNNLYVDFIYLIYCFLEDTNVTEFFKNEDHKKLYEFRLHYILENTILYNKEKINKFNIDDKSKQTILNILGKKEPFGNPSGDDIIFDVEKIEKKEDHYRLKLYELNPKYDKKKINVKFTREMPMSIITSFLSQVEDFKFKKDYDDYFKEMENKESNNNIKKIINELKKYNLIVLNIFKGYLVILMMI